MSHELRTPLNAIIGVSEMLREDAEALKQDTEPLERMLGAGRELVALINDILDLSKIEAGRMELAFSSFSLAPLIADVDQDDRASGNQKLPTRSRSIAIPASGQCMPTDAAAAGVFEPMSNANKFTDRGTISIDAHQVQENGRDWITLAVTDTGIGMTPELMAAVAGGFSQASTPRRASTVEPAWASRSVNAFPDDGRRHNGGKRAGPWLHFHYPIAENCGSSKRIE